jgi:hypothetical protein
MTMREVLILLQEAMLGIVHFIDFDFNTVDYDAVLKDIGEGKEVNVDSLAALKIMNLIVYIERLEKDAEKALKEMAKNIVVPDNDIVVPD